MKELSSLTKLSYGGIVDFHVKAVVEMHTADNEDGPTIFREALRKYRK